MALKDSAFVKVYNYNPFILSVADKMLAPCYNYDEPTYDSISVSDLQYVNANSSSIRNGLVRFNKNEEDEIYKELSVDKSRILFNEEIDDIILHPTQEKLQELLKVIDSSVFDRVITIHQGLLNSGAYDISNRVTKTIEARLQEFRRNILSTNIQLSNKEVESPKDTEVEKIKEQNENLQAQLNQMQEMMAKLLTNQTVAVTKTPSSTETPKKKAGRPPKNVSGK